MMISTALKFAASLSNESRIHSYSVFPFATRASANFRASLVGPPPPPLLSENRFGLCTKAFVLDPLALGRLSAELADTDWN